jgi:hypothetical protein
MKRPRTKSLRAMTKKVRRIVSLLICILAVELLLLPDRLFAQTAPGTEQSYKVAIERYFNAYIKADLDTLLDALDPAGPMYPKPPAIKQLRETASNNALQGAATAKELQVIEQSAERARVSLTMFMRVDVNKDGHFREETSHPICELRLKEGKWRIFNCST